MGGICNWNHWPEDQVPDSVLPGWELHYGWPRNEEWSQETYRRHRIVRPPGAYGNQCCFCELVIPPPQKINFIAYIQPNHSSILRGGLVTDVRSDLCTYVDYYSLFALNQARAVQP